MPAKWIVDIKKARQLGAPLIALISVDQPSIINLLQDEFSVKEKEETDKKETPLVVWDIVRGFQSLNKLGAKALTDLGGEPSQFSNPMEALDAASKFPGKTGDKPGTVVVMYNAHRLMEGVDLNTMGPIQAIMNLRDAYKNSNRTLILLGPDFNFPPEIGQDILTIEEPLPTEDQIREMIKGYFTDVSLEYNDNLIERCTDALRGLAAFPIEQATFLSIFRNDNKKLEVKLEDLWERKRSMIKQVRGLSMERAGETFDQIGGLAQIKKFFERLFAGPRRPRVIVFLDEIEKTFGGAGTQGLGDTSGVSQDQLGTILSQMEDNKYSGVILLGPPGSGKSAIARAVASTYNTPLLRMDLGAAKGSLVGQSEQQIRAMMKAIQAIAGTGGAFFIATCNKLDSLPPELRRRFRYGLWFQDLCDKDERQSISQIHVKNYEGIKNDPKFWDSCEGWSGANIRDCCELAYSMQTSLKEAANFIVPAATQDPEGLKRLRQMASNRFLAASYAGTYQYDDKTNKPIPSKRTINLDEEKPVTKKLPDFDFLKNRN